jgi:hypothetical protein
METALFLAQLEKTTNEHLAFFESLKSESLDVLNWKENQDSWSVLECIEHLNLYGDFYFPEISKRIQKSKKQNIKTFHSGWVGSYFAKSMLPKDNMKKMKTFKNKDPKSSSLSYSNLDRGIQQLNTLIKLLQVANDYNIESIRIPTTLSSMLRLKLGDVFHFIVNHNERHIVQAKKMFEKQVC